MAEHHTVLEKFECEFVVTVGVENRDREELTAIRGGWCKGVPQSIWRGGSEGLGDNAELNVLNPLNPSPLRLHFHAATPNEVCPRAMSCM